MIAVRNFEELETLTVNMSLLSQTSAVIVIDAVRGEWLNDGGVMTELNKVPPITLQELIVSSLAQTDALAKLLIEKDIITQQEFLQKISEERATYQRMLN